MDISLLMRAPSSFLLITKQKIQMMTVYTNDHGFAHDGPILRRFVLLE